MSVNVAAEIVVLFTVTAIIGWGYILIVLAVYKELTNGSRDNNRPVPCDIRNRDLRSDSGADPGGEA